MKNNQNNKNNQDKKINIKTIWKFLRSEKGKRYSFVIFYVFFFAFLFILMSLPNTSTNNKQNNQVESSLPFKITNLEQSNYTFNYVKKIDNNSTIYLGKRNDNQISLILDDNIYIYNYQNSTLKPSVDNESDIIYQFLDIYELKRIIKNSTYISKTEFPDGNINYNYEIDNNTLANILNMEVLDNSNLINKIIVNTNKTGVLDITFDLLNLMNNTSNVTNSYLEYKTIITYGDNNE